MSLALACRRNAEIMQIMQELSNFNYEIRSNKNCKATVDDN